MGSRRLFDVQYRVTLAFDPSAGPPGPLLRRTVSAETGEKAAAKLAVYFGVQVNGRYMRIERVVERGPDAFPHAPSVRPALA